ncbi:MAG TPA: cytochrome b/b6 domain-containing protein [Terriglobales bacterium]|nr:cytochrome b/b6 domain-containing protein [Terriglobales bacterium]
MSPEFFWACVWLAVGFCAIHVIRRARSSIHPKTPAGYNWNQRLYHWGNVLLLTLVAFSGYWLFFRRSPQAFLGLTWLQIHSWSGLLFAAGVVFHAFAAVLRGDWRSMRPERRDVTEARIIWQNFLGKTNKYPFPGKYDALQKIYHHILSLLAVTFTVSGVVMWLSAERFYFLGRDWIHTLRLMHDASALVLIVMVVGHIYFSIIKVNRQNLRDMAGMKVTPEERKSED